MGTNDIQPLSTKPLSTDKLDDFSRDGFLLQRQLFSADEMQGLLDFARHDSALMQESYVRRDADGAETRLALRNELEESSVYTAVVRSHRIVTRMQQLLGNEVYHYHHKMMLKEPRVGGAWEWHQDYGYWYNNGCLYPDMGSCMIAVDSATKENGCLQIIPGSHKFGRIDHIKVGEQVGADPTRVEAALQRLECVHCEMQPGDALFFHGNLLHRSDQNTSDRPRWSLICCYNTRHNDPFIRNGRHPNYEPLEVWPDERLLETIRASRD